MTILRKPKKGRASIFRGKSDGARVQGVITQIGARRFQRVRERLAALVGREPGQISDADVVECAVRGWKETEAYIRAKTQNS